MKTTIELKYPVTVGGESYASIALRRPKARDLEVSEKKGGSPMESTIALIADLAEVPVEVIRELELYDFNVIAKVLTDFTEGKEVSPK